MTEFVPRPTKTAQAVAKVYGWMQPENAVHWGTVIAEHRKLGLPISIHFPLMARALAEAR
jgi:hypothetical protein